MKSRRWLEVGAFIVLFALFARVWIRLSLRAPSAQPSDPVYFAILGATLVFVALLAVRLLPSPLLKLERLILAVFLAGMPVIYLWAVMLAGDHSALLIESMGLVIFVVIAVVGYQRSTLLLGLGIVAHGLLWDAWHHNHAPYIDAWYPVACLIMDLGFGPLAVALHLASRNPPSQVAPADGSADVTVRRR